MREPRFLVGKRGSCAGLGSDGVHAGGLRALLTLADLELDALALVEAAESASVDFGVVHGHVGAAAVGGAMKPKPFSPLNHCTVPCVISLLLAGGDLPPCAGTRPTEMPCLSWS